MRTCWSLLAWTLVWISYGSTERAFAGGNEDTVRLELTDGRVIRGAVFDTREGYLEVRERQGSAKIPKSLVLNWSFAEGSGTGLPPTLVLLKSGHEVAGKVDDEA